MAPEQAEGEVDPRADLFSLGCVLYRMVTGQLAFPGPTPLAALRAVATVNPVPARQINPQTPEALSRLIAQLLSKDRADRPASAGVVAQALEDLGRSAAVPSSAGPAGSRTPEAGVERPFGGCPASPPDPATPPGPAATAPPTQWQRRVGFAAAGLVLAVALVLAILWPWSGPPQPQDSVPAPDKLRVLSLDVQHFATVEGRRAPRGRLLGRDSFVTHGDDGVEVAARLSGPAYAFLIAFRPDGTEMVCWPEKEDAAPPRTDRLRFPSASTDDYGLEEGSGLQAFAVVASNQTLPPFRQWWSRPGCPWKKSEAPPEVVWRAYDGATVEGLTADPAGPRGPREVQGKASVGRLADWLSKCDRVEAVAVLGFAVLPKDQP
jgi:hypothetical protein